LEYTELHLTKLAKFHGFISNRNYYAKQTSLFYSSIKQELEKIVIKLSYDDIPKAYKKQIMHSLLDNIDYCGPGIFNHIMMANMLLTLEDSVESWLAILRNILILQLADQHRLNKKISERHSTHVRNIFLIYAANNHFNALGFEKLQDFDEIHQDLAHVSAEI